jgi:hypothetical protein
MLWLAGALSLSMAALAEDIVVVVNSKVGVSRLSRNEVVDIFMGRSRQFPSGVTALPLDLAYGVAQREQFYKQLTGKNIAEINAYWARLTFSGRASPPAQVRSQEEAMLMVIDNRSAIAYAERSRVSSQVKIVFEFTSP